MPRRRIRSKQHARRRKETRRRRWIFYGISSVILLALLIGLTHWSAVQIEEINVEVDAHAEPELIVDLAENILSEPWLAVISRNNILLLPRSEIRKRVKSASSRIESIDVDITGFQAIDIVIQNRTAVAEVCQNNPGENNCRLVDESGFIFSEADMATSTSPDFTYTVDLPLQNSTRLLPANRFQSLHSFIEALADFGMYAQQAHIKEYGDVVIPVQDKADSDAEARTVDLKINFYDDLPQVASNLQTVIDNESFVSSTSTEDKTKSVSPFALDYIDLRFENKVFYK